MSSSLQRARRAMRRLGLDVSRYPASDPLWRLSRLLQHHKVGTVCDVGANDGTFATTIRRLGYRGSIHCFEPVDSAFQKLSANLEKDSLAHAHNCALGADERTVDINIAGNDAASSSMLQMLDRHRDAAPGANFVGVQEVTQHRLDDVADQLGFTLQKVFLKLDVQGYERQVLEGARRTLAECVGLQIELSLVPLYEGGLLWEDGLDLAASLDMRLVGVAPGFTDTSGELLQFDATFVSRGASA